MTSAILALFNQCFVALSKRCGCKSGPVELACAASRCSVALVVRPRVAARAYDRTSGPPLVFFRLAAGESSCSNYYGAFEQGVISRNCPLVQPCKVRLIRLLVVSIYSCLQEKWTPAGGSVLLFGYGSPRQAPAVNLVCTLRSSSDSHQTRASGISLKRISRPLPLLLTPRGTRLEKGLAHVVP